MLDESRSTKLFPVIRMFSIAAIASSPGHLTDYPCMVAIRIVSLGSPAQLVNPGMLLLVNSPRLESYLVF
jgi:hypothetical protein